MLQMFPLAFPIWAQDLTESQAGKVGEDWLGRVSDSSVILRNLSQVESKALNSDSEQSAVLQFLHLHCSGSLAGSNSG